MAQSWGCCLLILIGLMVTVDGQCDGIELTVDDQPLIGTVLYKPVGSSGLFVTCQKCDDNINKLTWHSLTNQSRLSGCNKAIGSVCTSKIDSRARGLNFLTFTPSLAGVYECRISGGFRLPINISVLDPPSIITSPSSFIKRARSTPRTLTCEASSYDGQVLYHWEGKRFQETQWTVLTEKDVNGNSYMSFTASSYQYRCVASNDAGETRSEIASITILTSIINSQDKVVPVGGGFNLTCTSSVSSNVIFLWTRDRMPTGGVSISDGGTSTLTLSDVEMSDAGSYVCSVRVSTLVVMSDPITIDTVIIDPPVITEHPVGGDVPIGMNITLECEATGRGSLQFSWQRHHAGSWSTINTDSTTSYTATTSGSYRCVVSNEAGSVMSNRTRVNIYGPPTITIQPASQLSTIGMTITLTCEGTGRGLLTYYWEQRERRNRWELIDGSNSSRLTIRDIQNSNQFRCTVSNEAGSTTTRPAGITILEILSHPQAKLVALRSTLNFTCTSSVSSNVIFSWSHNGRSINGSSTTGDTSILTFTSVRESDAGSYVCTVRSGSVSVMSNVAILTVYGPPVITSHPTDNDVPVGESAPFSCRASGTGTLEYSWENSSGSSWTTVSNDNTTSYTTDTTLAIGQYMYRCRVSNEAGSVVSNIATVNVYDSPTITTHPSSQLTNTSISVTLNCEGTGRGSITYQWETSNINGGQWMNISNSNNKTLVVGTLEQSQQYRCVVSNEAGSTRSNVATVTVLKIITHPQDKVVAVNSMASLTCTSSVSSNVTLTWSHNGKSIRGSSTTDDASTSILTFTSVKESDVGSYVCTVRSESVSVMSNAATLTIYGPPVITTQPISVNIPIRGSVTLSCRASGQEPMTYTWETHNDISDWHAVGTSNTTSYTVRTETDGNFTYRCRVHNEAGSVISDEAIINVFGPPRISPLQPQFHAELGKEFQINCTATNIPDASVNLMFSWSGPTGVRLDYTTTDEDDSRTATSTLHINTITHNHGGVYQCIVRNGGSANDTTSSEIVVQVHPTRPREFNIISEDINSLTVTWNNPAHTHRSIDHFNLYYNQTEQTDQTFVKNIDPQSRTYVLADLKPYTEYSIYVTAVRMIGTPVRPLEGMKSKTVNGRTLAGRPVIVVDDLDDKPEWIINSDYSTENTVNLPTITAENGPFSHLYIIVYTISNTTLVTAEHITTEEILEETTKASPLFYVAAAIHADQYRDGYRMKYTLGVGDTTTDPDGNVFHNNREIVVTTLFFFRAFSINSTRQREISTTTSMQTLVIMQEELQGEGIDGNSDSGNSPSIGVIIAGIVIALIIIILAIILSIVLLLICRKRSKRVEPVAKMVKTKSASTITIGSSPDVGREACTYVVPTSGGSDTDSSLANPMFKIKMESSNLMTSVGQPTTLMIALPDIHRPTITWKKDGQTVNHPVLSDGSLYIVNTTLSDQGRYIVTVNSDGSTESATLHLTVINPQMPTDNLRHKPIKVDKLAKHVGLLKTDDSGKLEADFESASYDVPATQHAARLICNISKNRFTNIMPYDHSRVVLNHQDHLTGSDYINASFIDGYAKGRAYIAAQGPLNNTVDDFWRMIWEQNVTTIVMLTRLVEDAKIKCCQYWPNQGGSTDYGSVKVTLQKEDQLANYCVRQLSIKKESNNTYETRVIHQFHFTTWPDHGVPDRPTVMLDFLRIINRYHDRDSTTPILVHCSAGVGRTGTLIAIDSEIERIKLRNAVNVFECVSKMRYHRNHMVQTPEQYEFIYSALLEYITCGDTSIAGPLDNLKSKIEELSNAASSTRKTKLQTQFEKLSNLSCKENDFTYTAAKSSPARNRSEVYLPPDSSRISLLRFHGSSDYINACFINGYHKRKAFLVGPGPMLSTAIDFWTMIWEKKSHVVVMLGQLKENGEDVSSEYWNGRSESGDFVIETQSEKHINKDVVHRIIKVTNTKEISTRIITQLQYVEWSQNSCPSDPTQMVDLIRVLEEQQHKTSNGPITVHCSDGVGRSGAFCALMVCINQFRTEKVVDVFRTIHIMRGQRPGIVGNVDQYKFIHKTLVTVLQQSSS